METYIFHCAVALGQFEAARSRLELQLLPLLPVDEISTRFEGILSFQNEVQEVGCCLILRPPHVPRVVVGADWWRGAGPHRAAVGVHQIAQEAPAVLASSVVVRLRTTRRC